LLPCFPCLWYNHSNEVQISRRLDESKPENLGSQSSTNQFLENKNRRKKKEKNADPIHTASAINQLDYDYVDDQESHVHKINRVSTSSNRLTIFPLVLADRLIIPLKMTERTLKISTQLALRSSGNPIIRYLRICITKVLMDMMFVSKKLIKS